MCSSPGAVVPNLVCAFALDTPLRNFWLSWVKSLAKLAAAPYLMRYTATPRLCSCSISSLAPWIVRGVEAVSSTQLGRGGQARV